MGSSRVMRLNCCYELDAACLLDRLLDIRGSPRLYQARGRGQERRVPGRAVERHRLWRVGTATTLNALIFVDSVGV